MPDGSDYYQFANRMAPHQTVRSGPFDNEYDAIQAGFGLLPLPAEIKQGRVNYGLDSGTANHYVITSPYPIPGLVEGLTIEFHAIHDSIAGAADVDLDGLGPVAVTRNDGTALNAGDILIGPATIKYDGTKFRVAGSSQADALAAAASAVAAAASALAAANSALTAASYAASLSGTSTDSRTIGTGSRTFNTQSGKQWVIGQRLRVANDASHWMDGAVTSYTGTTLVILVDLVGGAGTLASWSISLAGPQGPQGAQGLAGAGTGDMLGANNLSELADKDVALTTLGGTMVGKTLFKAADAPAQRTALGLGTAALSASTAFQPVDTDLTAIAALVSAANKAPYATGAGAWALYDLTAKARLLLACADEAAMRTFLSVTAGFIPRGWLSPDFAFSNNVATPNTKIDYSAGQMTDGANAQVITVASGTINLATTGVDALDTGTLSTSTPYWLFIITNGTLIKGLASLSRTAPTMPGGYTVKRRCGAFWTDASAHVVKWIVAGPGLYMVDSPNVLAPLVSGTAAQTGTAPLPTGKKWQILVRVGTFLAGSVTIAAGVFDPDGTAQTPSVGRADAFTVGGTANEGASSPKEVTTNTSSQFKATGINGATTTVSIIGWREDGLS